MANDLFNTYESDLEASSCTHGDCANCGHDHDHDHDTDGSALITMVDEETGEEYTFEMVDSIEMDGETYCLLATVDEEPEAVFVKVVTDEDGSESLMSLDDDEFDRVAAAYESVLDEEFDDDDDEDGDEDDE